MMAGVDTDAALEHARELVDATAERLRRATAVRAEPDRLG